MDLTELARLGKQMRDAQKRAETKRPADVRAARDWAERFDLAVQSILCPPQPGLFDKPIKEEG